jgi:hypothetical protein
MEAAKDKSNKGQFLSNHRTEPAAVLYFACASKKIKKNVPLLAFKAI